MQKLASSVRMSQRNRLDYIKKNPRLVYVKQDTLIQKNLGVEVNE